MTVAFLAVSMALEEVVVGHLKNDGKQHEQFTYHIFVDVSCETLNFGPVLVDDVRMRSLQLRDELGDIVDLRIVIYTGSYFL